MTPLEILLSNGVDKDVPNLRQSINMFISSLRKAFHFLLDIAQTLVLSIVFFIVIWFFFFRPFQVNGLSMFPTFKDKEYVLANIIGTHFSSPKHGDVVVFKAPPNNEQDFIKRIIGIPGDKIMIKNGYVYVNGLIIDENKYLKADVKTYGGAFLKETQEITIPPDQYIALGDNRMYSSDSREWGFVPKDFIIGKSFFAYWPLEDMQIIKNPYSN